jgi:opacity protein-like surface antigen
VTAQKVTVNIAGGPTFVSSTASKGFGTGGNFELGVTFNVTPLVGIQAEYGGNRLGSKDVTVNVAPCDGCAATDPTPFTAHGWVHYGDFNLVLHPMWDGKRAQPYFLGGVGVCYRSANVTTPGIGYVPGYCSPWWYYCVPGGYVPVDNIVGSRSETDFGLDFGAGVNVKLGERTRSSTWSSGRTTCGASRSPWPTARRSRRPASTFRLCSGSSSNSGPRRHQKRRGLRPPGGHVMTRQGVVFALLIAAAVAVALVAPAPSAAQTKSQAAVVTQTFTIVAIDATNRTVTLKDKDGYTDSIYAGPEVKRFNELKVGDKVTFKYYESVVYQIQKPSAAPAPAGEQAGIVRGKGPKPGGTVSRQITATVTVTAIDMKVPSVTIKMDDGSISSFKVENKKNLEGVKVGDRVQITYTEALAISVAPGK